jgi:hypothetical protein
MHQNTKTQKHKQKLKDLLPTSPTPAYWSIWRCRAAVVRVPPAGEASVRAAVVDRRSNVAVGVYSARRSSVIGRRATCASWPAKEIRSMRRGSLRRVLLALPNGQHGRGRPTGRRRHMSQVRERKWIWLGFLGALIYLYHLDYMLNREKHRDFSAKVCNTNLQQLCSVRDKALAP